MKKYSALDAAKFAGVEDKFKEVLKRKTSDDEGLFEELYLTEELSSNENLDGKIQKIKDDFISSDFVDISEL